MFALLKTSIIILFFTVCSISQAQVSCDSMLTVLYSFTNSATDESGNNFHGELQGGVVINEQLNIPRDSFKAVIVPSEAINGAYNFSFSTRVKFDQFHIEPTFNNYPGINHILSGFLDNNAFNLGYKKKDEAIAFSFDGTYQDIYLDVGLELNTWYCMAVVREGHIMRVYIDGVQVSGDIVVPSAPVKIAEKGFILGQDQDCLSGCYELNHSLAGSLDNFRIYGRAINEDEIIKLCEKTYIEQIICPGEHYFGYTQSGNFVDNFITQNGCDSIRELNLSVSDLSIDNIFTENSDCGEPTGFIEIFANSNVFPIIGYQLNNGNMQEEFFFENISQGEYLISVIDSFGCEVSTNVKIEVNTDLAINNVEITNAACGKNNGKVFINAMNGIPPYKFSTNGINFQENNLIENIAGGNNSIFISDSDNCIIDTLIFMPESNCPLYIPNVFSPNDDGINDFFKIHAHPNFTDRIIKFLIFDRWGALVYESYDVDPLIFNQWWDGTFQGKKLVNGVFAYLVQVERSNDEIETYSGSVMILK